MSTKVDGLTGLRRAFAAAPAADMPRADCPPASRIWEAARGELAPARLRETLYHVAGCTVCTEAWRLAQALEEGSEVDLEESPEETPAPPGASRFRWFRQAGGAAAAAVIVLVFGLQLRDGGDADSAFRAPEAGEIELLSKGPLARDDCRLRWRGPEKAGYYRLVVRPEADLMSPLAEEAALEKLEYRLPPEVLARLPPGAVLLVRLEAVHPIEGALAARTFRVTVR